MATRLLPAQALVSEGFFLELPSRFGGWKHALSIAELFQVMKPTQGPELRNSKETAYPLLQGQPLCEFSA